MLCIAFTYIAFDTFYLLLLRYYKNMQDVT